MINSIDNPWTKTEYVIRYASMFSFEAISMLQSLDLKP